MSQINVDNIKNRTGGAIGAPSGAVVTGVTTTGSIIVGAAVTINAVTTAPEGAPICLLYTSPSPRD